LVIERNTTSISVVKDDSVIEAARRVISGPIYGIVGIMNVLGVNYLGVIENAAQVGTLNNAKIYKITTVNMVPFRLGNQLPQAQQMVSDVKSFLEDGFYFSYGYDLTASRQRRLTWMQQKSADPLKLIACDHQYFWNLALYRDFLWQKVDARWFTPLIQGYFAQSHGPVNGLDTQFTLISRRMWHGAGTRYNARGINDQGYVANFCETEQIMVVGGRFLISHVQIRGSVPVFW